MSLGQYNVRLEVGNDSKAEDTDFSATLLSLADQTDQIVRKYMLFVVKVLFQGGYPHALAFKLPEK